MSANHRPQPPLTKRQREIYELIVDKIVNRGYGPTVREIGQEFGIRSPNGVMCHLKALEKKGLITREPHMSRAIQLTRRPRESTSLPMAGQVAAGTPVLAEEERSDVDFGSLFDDDDHVVLAVTGDSMADAHIADGDFVVVKERSTPRDGDIVVVLDESQPTLRRLRREKGRVRLEPGNKRQKATDAKDATILGKVVGVVRRY